jgi:hypothetical protein
LNIISNTNTQKKYASQRLLHTLYETELKEEGRKKDKEEKRNTQTEADRKGNRKIYRDKK